MPGKIPARAHLSRLPAMRIDLVVGLALLALAAAQTPTYIVGPMGWSCADACHAKGLNCNPRIVTNNSPAQFASLGIKCTPDPAPWCVHRSDLRTEALQVGRGSAQLCVQHLRPELWVRIVSIEDTNTKAQQVSRLR